nr:hypothetical protein [Tanacetum cinerariifolium]
EEQLAFLADPRVVDCQVAQTITHNAAFQTDDLDAYDSDCDDIYSTKAVLMANLLSYDSKVLSKLPFTETYQNDLINEVVDGKSGLDLLQDEDGNFDDSSAYQVDDGAAFHWFMATL